MVGKKKSALLEADRAIHDALDGQIDLLELLTESESSVKRQFMRENFGKEQDE